MPFIHHPFDSVSVGIKVSDRHKELKERRRRTQMRHTEFVVQMRFNLKSIYREMYQYESAYACASLVELFVLSGASTVETRRHLSHHMLRSNRADPQLISACQPH